MPKLPRRPRSIPRSLDALPEVLAGRRVVATVDPRQADLFAPTFIEPCKPVLSARVPAGERWQYEIKHDGYRAQVHMTGGEVRIFTKSGRRLNGNACRHRQPSS